MRTTLFVLILANPLLPHDLGAAEKPLFPNLSDTQTAGLWLFDEPQYLNMTLTDASENLYDLRLLSGGRLVRGRFGSALRVNPTLGPAARGASVAREFDDSPWMRPDARHVAVPERVIEALASDDWTLELWLKPAAAPDARVTLLEYGTGFDATFGLDLDTSANAFVLRRSAQASPLAFSTDTARITDGDWHHVALVSKEGILRHYLDGRPQADPEKARPATARQQRPGLVGAIFTGHGRFEDPLNMRAGATIDFHWNHVMDMAWCERWRGHVELPEDISGTHEVEFFAEAGGGVRLVIDDNTVIDGQEGRETRRGAAKLSSGQSHTLLVELYVVPGNGRYRLLWRLPGKDWEVVPGSRLSHTSTNFAAAREEVGEAIRDRFYWTIGNGRLFERPFDGSLDELRFSSIARYTSKFAPPASFSINHGPQSPQPVQPTGPPLLFTGDWRGAPVPLGSRKHVFIDDLLVEAREYVGLVANPPVLRDEDRKGTDGVPTSTYERDGREIVFVETKNHPRRPDAPGGDGRVFEIAEPQLPEARFLYAGRDVQRGLYLWMSPDGLHWRRNETILLPFDPDGGVEMFWDDQRGKFVTYLRSMGWNHARPPLGRAAAVAETREVFKPWPFLAQPDPEVVTKAWTLPTITDELPVPFQPYPERGFVKFVKRGHVYRTRAIKYPWAPDTYLAFVWRLFYPEEGGDEIRTTELATSRDGLHWKFHGEPYYYDINWELEPDWRVIEALARDGLVRRGDELWQYAWIRNFTHHVTEGRIRTVRFIQRLDGFVSLDAGDQTGWFQTRPITFEGQRLEINTAMLAPEGWLRVALLDARGDQLPEFTSSDCEPIRVDSTRHVVRWRGNPDLGKLAGQAIRLRVDMQQAKLFAFQFQQNDDSSEPLEVQPR